MKLREHQQTEAVIDAEEVSIAAYLNKINDKSSDEYTKAVMNLKTLEETRKLRSDTIAEKTSLASEFFRGMAGGAVSAGAIYMIWHSEATGDVMLNTSNKSFIKDAAKLRFRPGH